MHECCSHTVFPVHKHTILIEMPGCYQQSEGSDLITITYVPAFTCIGDEVESQVAQTGCVYSNCRGAMIGSTAA